MKQHRDFVTYVRNGVEINALVAFSHDIYTPATQEYPAHTTEHLTVVYLDPAMASVGIQTGEQLRGSIKIEFSVPPIAENKVNGWKEVEDHDAAFTAAIQWRQYAAVLENALIADGRPNMGRIASDETRTSPPDDRIEGSPRTQSGQKFGEASELIARLRTDLANEKNRTDGANKYIEQLRAEKADLEKKLDEQKIVTAEGKTQSQLDAEHAEQRESETQK